MSIPSPSNTPGSSGPQGGIPTVQVSGQIVKAAKPLSGIEKAGFWLAICVLFIALVYIILLCIMLYTKDFDSSKYFSKDLTGTPPDSTFTKRIELFRVISDEKTKYREFIQQTSQTILLNLLLPILTAIIGYIFGARRQESTPE